MSPTERRAALGLAGIYGSRMLGLFLILPVFALFAEQLPEATPLLAGLAVGIYGLTQALLQIPYGLLSDRLGRKPVILAGLLLFAAGSVVAATADDIWWIIAGRALQGSGAVAAAVMALAADLTRESQRTKVMAVIGTTIGMSFMLAMIAAPALDAWLGMSGIFWLTAVLALLGMVLLLTVVPSPVSSTRHRDAQPVPAMFRRVLGDGQLLRLDWGIFSLHLVLTALFLVVPLALRDAGLAPAQHSLLYAPVMLLSIAAMVPFIILAERRGRMRRVFLGAVATLTLALLILWGALGSFWGLVAGLWLFFVAFNLLEATLPSLVSKVAPADAKGTAMGVYSTGQFAGAFAGGLIGGWAHQAFGLAGVLLLCAAVTGLWLLVAAGMLNPGHQGSRLVKVAVTDDRAAAAMAARLGGVPGVVEAVVVAADGVAYLKVDKTALDEAALDAICAPGA
jgi:MFS family permease